MTKPSAILELTRNHDLEILQLSLRHQRPGLTTREETTEIQVANGSDGSMSLVKTDIIREIYYILFPEKKILPFSVLLVGAIYTAVSAVFYLE